MAFFVYRPQSSTSAKELAAALGGRRLRYFENGTFFRRLRSGRNVQVPINRGDVVVGWGAAVPPGTLTARLLNGAPLRNKYQDALALKAAEISTVEVSRTRPQAAPAVPAVAPLDPARGIWDEAMEMVGDFQALDFGRAQPVRDGIRDFGFKLAELQGALMIPAPIARPVAPAQPLGNWIGRMKNHVGGDDLLTVPAQPDFFVKKEEFVEEFRVHSFAGKSIRAGKKVLRDGFMLPGGALGIAVASPWVRSWDGGWRIAYDGVSSKKKHRVLAHAAVAALGLQFGAVDIGQRANGSLVVLEVNRAAGLEGGTILAYAQAIRRLAEGVA